MRMKHRILSLVLTVCLVAGLLPTTVFAATVGGFEVEGGTEGTDYSYANGVLTILTSTELTISTSGQTGDRIAVGSGVTANIVLAGVNIPASSESAIDVPSGATVNITLAENSENTLKGGLYGAGIHAPAGSTLTISCAKHADGCTGNDGCGTLSATGGTCWGQWATWINGGAGIGGKNNETAGTIIINGGKIYAKGGDVYDSRYSRPAGIGGGAGVFGWGSNRNGGNGGTVIINGGYVQAVGSHNNNGIGGGTKADEGADGTGGFLQINGGTLYATSFNKGTFVSTGGELTDCTTSNSTVAAFTDNNNKLEITANNALVETITAPDGQILTANPEGGVTLPPDSMVQAGEQAFTLPHGGSFGIDCSVTADVVVRGDTVITGAGVTISLDGTLGIPNGSTVQTGEDGAVITLPNGGSVEENGTVSGKSVKVGETTITAPEGSTVSTTSDGTTTAPAGSAIETGIGVTLITGAYTPAEVSPDGTVTLSGGGTVTVHTSDGTNVNVVITVPSTGGSLGTDDNGYITLPGGVTVTTDDETPILIPEIGGLLDPNTGKVFYVAVPINPGNTVRYIVEHYKASGDGYTLEETEYPAGKIGDTVTATPKTYDSFTYNASISTASGTLKKISGADDILTLKLYYDVSATPIEPGDTVRYIVEHYKASGDGYTLEETEYPAGKIGDTVTATPKTYDSFTYNASISTASGTLKKISGADDILTLKLYYDVSATPIEPGDTVRYIVEHYKASGDGYTLEETEYLGGTIGETVTAQPKTYTGYTYNPGAAGSVAKGTLKTIGSAEDIVTLKLYYDLTIYTVTVENDGHGEAAASPASATMGGEITLTAAPNSGYQFKEWEIVSGGVMISNSRFTMPADNVTVKAIFERQSSGGDDGYTPPTYRPDVEDTQGGGTSWAQQTGSPKTGDGSHMGLWLFTLCASAGTLAALMFFRRREKENRQLA